MHFAEEPSSNGGNAWFHMYATNITQCNLVRKVVNYRITEHSSSIKYNVNN